MPFGTAPPSLGWHFAGPSFVEQAPLPPRTLDRPLILTAVPDPSIDIRIVPTDPRAFVLSRTLRNRAASLPFRHPAMPLRTALVLVAAITLAAFARAEPLLRGAIDLHCHSAPDVLPRSVDDLQLARLAHDAGMRAIVLKNHYTATTDRARLAMTAVPGIEVFGGIALNRAVGGINPEAVLRMVEMEGRRGRIVWLPTWDGAHVVRTAGETRPSVPVLVDGRPVPELAEVFRLVARHDLILATGHSSGEETLALISAARAEGVTRIVVTHALHPPLHATDGQLAEMIRRGALLELSWLQHHIPSRAHPLVPLARSVNLIQSLGAEHFVLSSDLGQAGNPPPPDGLRFFVTALRDAGISDDQLDLMLRRNPARLLGL
jgi:hypothetical protein